MMQKEVVPKEFSMRTAQDLETSTYGDETPLFPEADPEVCCTCMYITNIRNVFLVAGMTWGNEQKKEYSMFLYSRARD